MDKQMRMGGVGGVHAVDFNITDVCEKIRDELETKYNKKFVEFTPIEYKTQVMNGVNYYIKVRVNNRQDIHNRNNGGEYIHIRAHQNCSGDMNYVSHQDNMTLDDEVVFFEMKEGNE